MPGPSPAYQPKFPPEFVDQMAQIVRQRTVAHRIWQRAQLALLLHQKPTISNPEAAGEIGLHENAVRCWRRRWASGDFSLEDRAGRGRKPHFSPLGSRLGESLGL